MTENYTNVSLNNLFDSTKRVLERKKLGLPSEEDIIRSEKNSWINYNTTLLSKAIVQLLKDIMVNIQISANDYGVVTPKEFKKYYAFGDLKENVEAPKVDDDNILSIFDDAVFEYKDELNYDTLNSYKMTSDGISLILNFSYSHSNSCRDYYRNGDHFEYDSIDLELLENQLNEYGITAKLHKQFGLDTSGTQTINTILLEINYYRNFEKNKTK